MANDPLSSGKLLPGYMVANSLWTDVAGAADKALNDLAVPGINNLGKLRDNWILKDSVLADDGKIAQYQLLNPAVDLDQFETEILIRQINQLGLFLRNDTGLTDNDLQRIVRNVSQYWYDKGAFDFIDFLGFCLDCVLTMVNLWTTDYRVFYPEGDAAIGTPVWLGGTWYPTTHIRVSFDVVKFAGVDESLLVKLFYALANYNLVLESINTSASYKVVGNPGDLTTDIVALVDWDVLDSYIQNNPSLTPALGLSWDHRDFYSALPARFLMTGATNATVVDHENKRIAVTDGEYRYGGYRRVQNLLAITSEYLSVAGYTVSGGAAKVGNAAGLGPESQPAMEVSFGATGGAIGSASAITAATAGGILVTAFATGRTYAFSVKVRAKTGSTSFRLSAQDGTTIAGTNDLTVTTNWSRWAYVFTGTSGGTYRVDVRNNVAGNTANIYTTDWQVEDITGQSVLGPGEYLRVGHVLNYLADPNYVSLNGTTGYASTPDAVANRGGSVMELIAEIAPTDWTPAASNAIIAKYSTNTTADSYALFLDTGSSGKLLFTHVSNVTQTNVLSSVSTGFADGSTRWVRCTWAQSTGYVNFYTSIKGVDWTQLGTANLSGPTTVINAGTRALEVGSTGGGVANFFGGKIYSAQVYVGGMLKADFNPNRDAFFSKTAAITSATTGEVWTQGGSASVLNNWFHGHGIDGTKYFNYLNPVAFDQNNSLYSEQLDNAYWLKRGINVTANQELFIDGNLTMDAVVEDTASSSHYLVGGLITIVAMSANTVSVYVKVKSGARQVRLYWTTDAALEGVYADFDLQNAICGPCTSVPFTRYAQSAGTLNSWYSTSDSAAASLTGAMAGRVRVSLASYTPASEVSLVSKSNPTGNQRSFVFALTTSGNLRFYGSLDGVTYGITATSTAVVPFTANILANFGFTRSGATVIFYTSTDGVTWTQLGASVTVSASALFDSTSTVEIGTGENHTTSPLLGKIYRARLINSASLTGTIVVDFNPASWTTGSTWTSATGEVWTINGLEDRIVTAPVFKESQVTGPSTMVPQGNGVWRLSVSGTLTATDTIGRIALTFTSTYGSTAAYAGDGTSGFFVSGIQHNPGNIPSAYQLTTASAVNAQSLTTVDKSLAQLIPVTVGQGLRVEPSSISQVLYNQAFTTAPWTSTLGAGTAQDQIGRDGKPNSAWTFTDTSAVATLNTNQVTAVPVDSNYHCTIAWVKKTLGGTSPNFGFTFAITGGTGVSSLVRVNTDLGTITSSTFTGAGSTGTVIGDGDWWGIVLVVKNNSTAGNTVLTTTLSPATSTHNQATDAVAATGSAIVDSVHVEYDSTWPTSFVSTGAATVTRGADNLYCFAKDYTTDASGYANVSFEHIALNTAGVGAALSSNSGGPNGAPLVINGASASIYDVTAFRNALTQAFAARTSYKWTSGWSGVLCNVAINGVTGTPQTFDTSMNLGDKLRVGDAPTSTGQTAAMLLKGIKLSPYGIPDSYKNYLSI